MAAWPPITTLSRKPAHSRLRDLLGPPPLLAGEDLAAYEALHGRIFKAIGPSDAIEEIWAGDIADLTWEAHRGRRLKADLVYASAHEGLNESLTSVLGEADRTALVKDWAKGDAASRRKAASALKRAGKSDNVITTMTQLVRLDALDKIDRLIGLAERRRNLTIRELERYRWSVSERRRRFRADIDNLEFVERPSRFSSG